MCTSELLHVVQETILSLGPRPLFGHSVFSQVVGEVWRPIGPVMTPNAHDSRLLPKPWLQMARSLVRLAVAFVPLSQDVPRPSQGACVSVGLAIFLHVFRSLSEGDCLRVTCSKTSDFWLLADSGPNLAPSRTLRPGICKDTTCAAS